MADKHILSLEVPDVANCEIMTIKDTSQYTSNLPVDCPQLQITRAGFNTFASIVVTKNFNLNLSACDLGVQTTNCSSVQTVIPDGIYIIKYSVSPNDKVKVEYNHLRVTSILTKYYKTLCDIDISTCEPHSERRDLIEEMQYIKTLIDGAVAKVEYCGNPHSGLELYNFALKRLEKISCKCSNVGC
tara:strand:+ start:5227 stop:5784 length:558 start_codon:yes stop_codon:yes gene_type:complete